MNEETRYQRDTIYKCKRCGEIVSSALLESNYIDFHVCEYDDDGNQKKCGYLETIGYDFRKV